MRLCALTSAGKRAAWALITVSRSSLSDGGQAHKCALRGTRPCRQLSRSIKAKGGRFFWGGGVEDAGGCEGQHAAPAVKVCSEESSAAEALQQKCPDVDAPSTP